MMYSGDRINALLIHYGLQKHGYGWRGQSASLDHLDIVAKTNTKCLQVGVRIKAHERIVNGDNNFFWLGVEAEKIDNLGRAKGEVNLASAGQCYGGVHSNASVKSRR